MAVADVAVPIASAAGIYLAAAEATAVLSAAVRVDSADRAREAVAAEVHRASDRVAEADLAAVVAAAAVAADAGRRLRQSNETEGNFYEGNN